MVDDEMVVTRQNTVAGRSAWAVVVLSDIHKGLDTTSICACMLCMYQAGFHGMLTYSIGRYSIRGLGFGLSHCSTGEPTTGAVARPLQVVTE